jgi:hypothetical protein
MTEPGGQALVKVTRGGVKRATERLWIGVQAIAKSLGYQAADVDDVYPRAGNELEVELDRR